VAAPAATARTTATATIQPVRLLRLFGGGAGADSGVGRVGGRFSMERLTELKTVVVNLG